MADEWAARGAPVVIVNPSAPIGAWDVKPTPTGQMIVDFLNGKMVGSVDTGLNLVHVRDVARGHILAAEKGRVGERYILGHRNLSLLEIFRMLSALTGVPAPRFRVPYAVAWMAAAAMEGVSRLTRRPPAVPPHRGPHGPQTHVLQLGQGHQGAGIAPDPCRDGPADAVAWFTDRGYAHAKRNRKSAA